MESPRIIFFFLLLATLFSSSLSLVEDASFSFSFQNFKASPGSSPGITLYGDAAVVNSSVRLNQPKPMSRGHVIYRRRLAFGRKPSFSTNFSFSLSSHQNGHGLVFLMASTGVPLDGRPSPGGFTVEFAGDGVGVSLGGGVSKHVASLPLSDGEKLRAWIDYESDTRLLKVGLGKAHLTRPISPVVSYTADLSGLIWKSSMAVGFACYSGNSTQTAVLYDWDFSLKHAATYLMHSEPLDPRTIFSPPARTVDGSRDYLPGALVGLAFGAVSGALVVILFLSVCRRPGHYSVHPLDIEQIPPTPPAKA